MAARAGQRTPDWRLAARYVDAWGHPRMASAQARVAIRAAMGEVAGGPEPVVVARPGQRLVRPGELELEDGTALGRIERLPRELAPGYHRLHGENGDQLLLVPPARCPLPAERSWGWSVQLYAARSTRSWGIGDLRDLRELAAWSAEMGAGILLVNPLGAPNPGPDPEPSPYHTSTRRFRNPLYLALEAVPGYQLGGAPVADIARRARALNSERLIERPTVLSLKQRALERLWSAGAGQLPAVSASLAAFRDAQGEGLRQWSTFAALAERHGSGWRRWPSGLRDARSAAAAAAQDRVDFHCWIQWLLDEQLRAAANAGPALVGDLPIGFDPDGFDAWAWQGLLADGACLGAPPDAFNPAGQDWGLPPFAPDLLRQAGYRPVIETLRAAMRHAGGLRIDHILGVFRQWWVPAGAPPADGAYVTQSSDELLAVLAIEAGRARAVVIGEDLGTIEPGVRRRLAANGILSTRLVYFERRPPAHWPRRALGAVTTHDLPTIAGAWSGEDLADQARAGVAGDAAAMDRIRRRLARLSGTPDAGAAEAAVGAHAALAASPSLLVTAALEDAALVNERPNLPGTIAPRRANWSLALPKTIEALREDGLVRRLSAALRR